MLIFKVAHNSLSVFSSPIIIFFSNGNLLHNYTLDSGILRSIRAAGVFFLLGRRGGGSMTGGGGVGWAIAYPVLKKFHDCGAEVHAVVGFKSKDVVILEDKFKAVSSVLKVCTDDGSYGQKGLVTEALKQLLDDGNQYDEIFAIGPMVMMKFVCKTTEPYGVPTTVSMSPIMIDGTGMCGGCRLTVGGETKFACVDGPDFDGHKVDWDLAVKRNQMYHDFEVHKHEEVCNLFKQEVK